MPSLPGIEAEGITAVTDRTRGAGAAERAAAAALGEVAEAADGVTNILLNHQKAVDAAEAAKLKNGLDLDAEQLAAREDLALNPDAFAKAWGEHRSAVIERTPSRYAREAGAYADQIGTRKQSEIVGKAATAQRKAAESALQERRRVILGKLDGHARQGPAGLASDAYKADLAEYTAVEAQLGNPNFGSSPAEAQGRMESANARFRTTATLVMAEMVYKNEGLAAAKTFIEGVVNDPSLPLSQADRDAVSNEAKQAVNLVHQAELEEARERRERERDERERQRDNAEHFKLRIYSDDLPSRGEVLDAVRRGDIDEGMAASILSAAGGVSRRIAADARRDARLAEALANPLSRKRMLQAASGDREAVRQAIRLVDAGLIDAEEAQEVAREYARAKDNPGYAAAVDYLAKNLDPQRDDRGGAVDHLRRLAGAGRIPPGKEITTAYEVAAKFRGRANSTLPAPIFSPSVPTSVDDVARRAARLRQLKAEGKAKITDAEFTREMQTLAAWRVALEGAKK